MKRLILSGIPCIPEAWDKIFPFDNNVKQRVIPFLDILIHKLQKSSIENRISDLVPLVFNVIEDFFPDQIIMHDIGVTIGILSLISFMKRYTEFNPTVILFNGAFGYFDVNKADHVLRIQHMSYSSFESEVRENGGEIDTRYENYYYHIQRFYKELVETNRLNQLKIKNNSHLNSSLIDLGKKVLIIASKNDPYIYFECLEALNARIRNSYLKRVNYGHFPYTGDTNLIKREINNFHYKYIL